MSCVVLRIYSYDLVLTGGFCSLWGSNWIVIRRVRKNCEKRQFRRVCPSVRMVLIGFLWADFHEIWYLSIFRNSVEKIQSSYLVLAGGFCSLWGSNWIVIRRVRKNCEKRQFRRVCPSVRMVQIGFLWADFHEIWYLGIFRNSAEKIQSSLISEENNECWTRKPVNFFLPCLAKFLLQWEMFWTNVVEKTKTHFVFSNLFFLMVPLMG